MLSALLMIEIGKVCAMHQACR